MTINAPSQNPLGYTGILVSNPPNQIRVDRAPTSTDINANIGDEWEDTSVTPSNFYKLANLYYNQATWVLLTAGTDLLSLSDNAGTVVYASSNFSTPPNNIQFIDGTGITIVGDNASHTMTVSATGIGLNWNVISASQTLAVGNGYVCTGGTNLSLALPATSSLGNVIIITLDGSTSFSVTQSAGQQIRMGNLSTTAGVGGSLTSTAQGDSITMVCSVADLKWNILASVGNPTIV